MRSWGEERVRAERLSAAVDRVVGAAEAPPMEPRPEGDGLLETARQLSRLPALLGPADPVFVGRVMERVARGAATQTVVRGRRATGLRPAWALAGVAVALLVLLLLTPWGHAALASFMAVFDLGRTEVRITPVGLSEGQRATAEVYPEAVQQRLTPETAREQVPFELMVPADLPPGYNLREMTGYTYPDMPAWLPQPFSVGLVYADAAGHEFSLRLFPITLGMGDQARVTGMNLQAAPIQEVHEVDLDGRRGVLLRLGAAGAKTTWQELVWEQGHLVLSLSSRNLSEEEILQVARSVR